MARKTFISYKFSESQNLRDRIIAKLGADSQFYQGETCDSPDLTDYKAATIKKNLTDMMYNTSVTIVIISPNMIKSKWIDWEIEYCLKEISRKDRTSKTNGIVGVIMKINGSCDWMKNYITNCHGETVIQFKREYLYPIIQKNIYNSNPPLRHCDQCNTYDSMTGSYITLVDEDTFLSATSLYIESAFDKSDNIDDYDLTKQR